MMGRVAIISGGGANIAYFAGYWYMKRPKYDALFVNSAASPIAVPLILGKYKYIVNKVLELDNSVYKGKPFKRNGKLKIIRAIWNLLFKDGVADASGLKQFIDNNLREEFWIDLQKQNQKEVIVSVTNYNHYRTKLKLVSNKGVDFGFFKQMVYASCLYHPMTKGLSYNGVRYHDGGHRESILVDEAIDRGYKPEEIDVYVLRKKPQNPDVGEPKNVFQTFGRTLRAYEDIRLYEDLQREIKRGNILKSNVHWMPKQIEGNSMNFDPKIMKELIELGKNDAK